MTLASDKSCLLTGAIIILKDKSVARLKALFRNE